MKKIWLYATILIFLVVLVFFILRENRYDTCKKLDGAVCVMTVEGHKLNLRVAYSAKVQEQGLMWVSSLDEGEGMIFVYDSPRYMSFWMKNTIIPLSIAFVEADGRISVIHDMYPQPGKPDSELPSYPSSTLVKYAIEVPLGWFKSRDIKTGSYFKIPRQLR